MGTERDTVMYCTVFRVLLERLFLVSVWPFRLYEIGTSSGHTLVLDIAIDMVVQPQ